MNFTFRPYRPGDEHQINQGFEKVFNQCRPLSEWHWKFGPDRNQSCILLAVDDSDTLIAHFAALKTQIQIDGAMLWAGQAVDNYCLRRPQAVQQRVFEKLVLDFYQRFGATSSELSLVFGFPGTRHQQLGQLRMGYCQPVPLQCWSRPIRHRFSWMRPFLKKRTVPPFQWILPALEIDQLWNGVAVRYPVAVSRTSARLGARYASRPAHPYHWLASYGPDGLQAWAVISLAGEVLRWVDVVWDGVNPDAICDLDGQAQRFANDTTATRSEIWLSGDARLASTLASLGWNCCPHPLDLHFSAHSFVPEIDAAVFAASCYVTMGDTDLV